MNKVLIACPIGDGKEYSLGLWFDWIANQTYEEVEIALCVNGKTPEGIAEKKKLLEETEIWNVNGKKIPLHILVLEYEANDTTKQRLAYARDKLRGYASASNFDFLFWLDSDTIPQVRDAIELLVKQNKDVISGLYFYKGTKQPVIIDDETQTNIAYDKVKTLVETGEVIKVWGFGMGCVLESKKAFETAGFNYEHKFEDWSEDFTHCDLLEKAGIERWFMARIICKHYHKKDFAT